MKIFINKVKKENSKFDLIANFCNGSDNKLTVFHERGGDWINSNKSNVISLLINFLNSHKSTMVESKYGWTIDDGTKKKENNKENEIPY